MTPVASMIAENQSLKKLHLRNNMIKDPGLAEFGVGLSENTSLIELDFSRNKIRGENSKFSVSNFVVVKKIPKFILCFKGHSVFSPRLHSIHNFESWTLATT